MEGGYGDTNGCIAGSLMGEKFEEIPEKLKHNILQRN